MSDLGDLYQEIILDHNRSPRNFRPLESADRHAEGFNPLCGDQLQVWVKFDGDRIADVSFQGSGCAISKAAASLMTTVVKGKTLEEAEAIFDGYHRMVTGQAERAPEVPARLAAFAGVRDFPSRVKCATLGWHALRAALAGPGTPTVTTE